MADVSFDQIFHELFTVFKLIVYTIFSMIKLLIKNFILPAKLFQKNIENKIVLITGAGTYTHAHTYFFFNI